MIDARLLVYFFLLSPVVMAENCSQDLGANPYPQFQIVAAAKTGSTSMYSYLCDHPDIQCAARKKELNLLRGNNIRLKTKKVSCCVDVIHCFDMY